MGTLVFSVDVMAPNNYMKFWLLRGLDFVAHCLEEAADENASQQQIY